MLLHTQKYTIYALINATFMIDFRLHGNTTQSSMQYIMNTTSNSNGGLPCTIRSKFVENGIQVLSLCTTLQSAHSIWNQNTHAYSSAHYVGIVCYNESPHQLARITSTMVGWISMPSVCWYNHVLRLHCSISSINILFDDDSLHQLHGP